MASDWRRLDIDDQSTTCDFVETTSCVARSRRLWRRLLGVPEAVAPESGRYPFVKTLAFVWRDGTLPASARAFVDFVLSSQGAALLRTHGYVPIR